MIYRVKDVGDPKSKQSYASNGSLLNIEAYMDKIVKILFFWAEQV